MKFTIDFLFSRKLLLMEILVILVFIQDDFYIIMRRGNNKGIFSFQFPNLKWPLSHSEQQINARNFRVPNTISHTLHKKLYLHE